ncbi:MAG TPA: hypothetical protein VFJ20_07785, partial [Gemmatimonadaceae bacterium]|nr:hypothetical protein [Gemmatimonadaceae bacterium]
PVTYNDTANYVDWHNDQGTFRIYKVCLGPNPGATYIGHDGTVGPGYIATVWNRNNQIVQDDTMVPAHVGPNGGLATDGSGKVLNSTALGMFGFHLVRRPLQHQTPFATRDLDASGNLLPNGANHAWQISGRWCNANKRPDDYSGYRGWGVRAFSTPTAGYYLPPSVNANVGSFSIEVVLGDEHDDLVSLRYTYRIGSGYVKQWVRVTTLCGNGTCDNASYGDVFIKEPKLIAGVNPQDPDAIDYGQTNIFNDGGHTATTLDRHNYWNNTCSKVDPDNHLCEWGGQNPRADTGGATGQCNDPTRRRARFWNPHIACADDPSCLVVAARGADTELGTSYPWNGPHGLDLWATRNVDQAREQAGATDTKADGYLETDNCHQTSAAVANRRWEMIGDAKTASCSYTTAAVAFHAWEGGTGTYDCEPLYYRLGPQGESYVVAMAYGFGAAPLP